MGFITSVKPPSTLLTKQENPNEWKYYYRVVIFRKDNKGPMLEIAGFMDEKIADGYMRNLVQNTEGWDDDKLAVDKLLYALPPWTVPDDSLESKIDFLINLEEKENKKND